MSGDSGPDYPVGAGIGGLGDCAGVRRTRALEAPNPAVLPRLVVGLVLGLRLNDGAAPTISVLHPGGTEAGAIIPLQELVMCMRLGVVFVAEVRSVNGGQVQLDVRLE